MSHKRIQHKNGRPPLHAQSAGPTGLTVWGVVVQAHIQTKNEPLVAVAAARGVAQQPAQSWWQVAAATSAG